MVLRSVTDATVDSSVVELTGVTDWKATQKLFEADTNDSIAPGDPDLWSACQAAHRGFQVGLEILLLVPRIGSNSGFSSIVVGDDFAIRFPDEFLDSERAEELARLLAPPPKASSDEIVAPMGGAFYSKDAPIYRP